jgi:hypothetical protein
MRVVIELKRGRPEVVLTICTKIRMRQLRMNMIAPWWTLPSKR